MSQDQQNMPEVHLGSMGNGTILNQNGQEQQFLFNNNNNNNGMMPMNGNLMMGQQQPQQPQQLQQSSPHLQPNQFPMMQQQPNMIGFDQPQQQQQLQQLQQQLQQQPPQQQQQQQQQPNQESQPQQQNQQEQLPGSPQMQQQNFNFNNELKRLQQLQQFNGQGGQNGLLGMAGQQQAMNQQAMLLQSMFDQKVQNPRFDANQAFNPMLQPGLMQDARLLMAQSQFPMAMQPMGEVPLPSPHSLFHRDGTRRMRGGVIEPFPEKLHRLLTEVEAAGRSDVISFVANGRAFAIHKPDKFFKEIVPLYFRQSRLSSFKRQLNLYGFELINTGPSRGGYFHELFVKDSPEMCRRMRRVAVKVAGSGNSKEPGATGGKGAPFNQPESGKFQALGIDDVAPTNQSFQGRKVGTNNI